MLNGVDLTVPTYYLNPELKAGEPEEVKRQEHTSPKTGKSTAKINSRPIEPQQASRDAANSIVTNSAGHRDK